MLDVECPLLQSILSSNDTHLDYSFRAIERTGRKNVGVLGLSFKAGTDDLRESPMVRLAETLLGKGYKLRIYDPAVSMAKIVGSNKRYIDAVIPHISSLLVPDVEQVLAHSEVVVIGNETPEYIELTRRLDDSVEVIDLVRL